ncbi:MAG TPA: oligosaccharide flippase family protein [Bryobacteraceae bacterium]
MQREIYAGSSPITPSACLEPAPPLSPGLAGRTPALRRSFLWTFAGNVAYAGHQALILVVLARLSTPQIVGRYTLALAITAPIVLLANLGLRVVQATDTSDEFRFGDYLALRLIMAGAAFLVIAAVTLASGYSRESAKIVLAVGIAKFIESISDIFFGLMQKHERMKYISTSMMIKGPLTLLAMAGIVYWTASLFAAVVGICAVWLSLLLLYDMANVRRFLSHASQAMPHGWSTIGRLARRAFPLGVVSFLVSANWNVSRYFLERSHGEQALGLFAVIAYFPAAATLVVDALGQSVVPRLAKYYAESRPRYRSLVLRLIALVATAGFSGALASAFFGAPVLRFLYGPVYAQHVDVLVTMMIAGACMYVCSIFGVSLTAAGCLKPQVPIYAAVTAVTAIGSAVLVGPYGLKGAAWTVLAGNVVWVVAAGGVFIRAAWEDPRGEFPRQVVELASRP